jgi:hypothetical protein
MARIHINDLPPTDGLTPEQEEQILGAGRKSFRPMLESLENREMYTVDATAALTAGVLNVQGLHAPWTPQDAAAALHQVGSQIQVLSGLKNEIVRWFDAAQVKPIDMLMSGGNALVNLIGLGKLSADARFSTKGDEGTADVRYINQAVNSFREWDEGGRHNKETTMANGHIVLEQSWEAGGLTKHFVTVSDKDPQGNKRTLVTAEDNGDGTPFVVTTTSPGYNQVVTKFDRYGGMWNGKAWVAAENQKLVERGGKQVVGEWKKESDGTLRWVVTTGPESDKHIEKYQGYGQNGYGEGQLLVEDYKGDALSRRETIQTDGTRTVENFGVENGSKFIKQTEVYNGNVLKSRVTVNLDRTLVEETWGADKNGIAVYTKNVWRTEHHGAEGSKDHISKTVITDGRMIVTGYHLKGIPVYHGLLKYGSDDATVTWVYKLNSDNTILSLDGYRAVEKSWSKEYSATWVRESWGSVPFCWYYLGFDPGQDARWSNGWYEHRPGVWGGEKAAPPPSMDGSDWV